ncbi:MAG: molybdopterin-dependent oxidoreductase [Steroidobacteraceae bacterium]|jgi:isoquinoline 1-oxidoreductase beta subunit|nr:molybdopterin-dependent oxidoreductase [Steroidobacteraceae bacterium]
MADIAARLDRRRFLGAAAGAAGTLSVAVVLPGFVPGAAVAAGAPVAGGTMAAGAVALRPYIEIAPSGAVQLWSPTSEMGQGTHTAHAAIIADELGVELARVTIDTAEPADPFRRRGAAGQPGAMGSGGSMGVRFWVDALRLAAAQAREMLVAAAAARLGVPAGELVAGDGAVRHAASGRALSYGELVAAAAQLAPPAAPPLRPAGERRYVGSAALRRVDTPPKVDGSQVFSADFRRPGMVYACARLAPVRGAAVARFDRASVATLPGVLDVVPFDGGVAVVARGAWQAMRAAEALQVEFAKSPGDALDSAAISAQMREGLGAATRAVAKDEGGFEAARARAARLVTADYEVPYLNHAPMEPWSCTIERDTAGTWRVWAPTQAQDRLRTATARGLGVPLEKVRVHTLRLGGGFGRRLAEDGVPGAVAVAKALDGRPVKFFWTREGEFLMAAGRPCAMARLTAALDADGRVIGLHVRTSGPSMARSFTTLPPTTDLETFVDGQALQNLAEARYRFGAVKLDYAMRHNHVPTGPWRSVGATQCAFFLESFVDEIARATRKDPLALRRELLVHDARALQVVETAAAKAGWGADGRGTPQKPLPKGHALGLAYYESYGSLCAHVAEVSRGADGLPRVHRVVCAIDCGEVVTPDGARAQVEGGIVQGLSAALYEASTIAGGAAAERNFDRYRLLRINEAPTSIEVHFVASGEKLGGIGEPGLPPISAAVANALARLDGTRVRTLPFAAGIARAART